MYGLIDPPLRLALIMMQILQDGKRYGLKNKTGSY
jgi:hypothetical protein